MNPLPSPSKVPAWWNSKGWAWCIKYDSGMSEYVVYPRGKSTSDPSAYYTDDFEDAVSTAIDLVERGLRGI